MSRSRSIARAAYRAMKDVPLIGVPLRAARHRLGPQPRASARPKAGGSPIEFFGKPLSKRLSKNATVNFNPLEKVTSEKLLATSIDVKKVVSDKINSGEYPLVPHPCYACGGHKFRRVAEIERFGFQLPTAICTSCGLVQSNPALPQAALFDFYKNYYRALYGANRAVAEETIRKKANNAGKAVYDYVKKARVLPSPSSRKLIVEVGAGDGSIVSYFADQGHNVIGVDFDQEYMATARKLGYDLRTGPLSAVDLPSKPHLIYYNHVLEHIAELNEEIATLSRVIADGGHVAIIVPGVKHLTLGSYKGDLVAYLQIAHVAHFSLATLTYLFSRHGFELVVGNERVQAVFKKTNCPALPLRGNSEYHSTIYSLTWLERRYLSTNG